MPSAVKLASFLVTALTHPAEAKNIIGYKVRLLPLLCAPSPGFLKGLD